MKKILALSIVLAMFIASIPAVLAEDPCIPPKDGCGWNDHNKKTVTTKATVVGCGPPCPPPAGAPTGGGTNYDDGPPIIKCKWEYDLQVEFTKPDPCYNCEDTCPDLKHDACPCEDGLQVKPR